MPLTKQGGGITKNKGLLAHKKQHSIVKHKGILGHGTLMGTSKKVTPTPATMAAPATPPSTPYRATASGMRKRLARAVLPAAPDAGVGHLAPAPAAGLWTCTSAVDGRGHGGDPGRRGGHESDSKRRSVGIPVSWTVGSGPSQPRVALMFPDVNACEEE